MKILLVYPEYPPTFWSFKYACHFKGRKVSYPPLGLLTIASMLPKEWERKLVDINIEKLEDKDIQWADYVFTSAMEIQQKSTKEVIERCKRLGVKVIAGGPFFTECYREFENLDHVFLGETESTFPRFLEDLENGNPQPIYKAENLCDLEKSPIPSWELAKIFDYSQLCLQYSRGCPFNCEFCQITQLFGRKVRTKSKKQVIDELEAIYKLGWRDPVFFVDDNFIGNKHKLKTEILPAIIEWMEKRGYPFRFLTQVSINLADDEELMRMMARAGFNSLFIGIESVDDDCFVEVGKFHNRNRDLVANVKKLQQFGLEVWAGLIVGFDSDKETIFDRMVRFMQESGVTIAMIGLLYAIKGTMLYKRLEKEGRLLPPTAAENAYGLTDFTLNFKPKMDRHTLVEGYKKILKNVYSPEPYYSRMITFLQEFKPSEEIRSRITVKDLINFARITLALGIFDGARIYYWKLFFWTLINRPGSLSYAVSKWGMGYHFRRIFEL